MTEKYAPNWWGRGAKMGPQGWEDSIRDGENPAINPLAGTEPKKPETNNLAKQPK